MKNETAAPASRKTPPAAKPPKPPEAAQASSRGGRKKPGENGAELERASQSPRSAVRVRKPTGRSCGPRPAASLF